MGKPEAALRKSTAVLLCAGLGLGMPPFVLAPTPATATPTTSTPQSARSPRKDPSPQKVAKAQTTRQPWINHYLATDRYKIKGRVWRYVSTELDTYFHEPNSREMLAQPPDIVIGFASRKDAEEAGYLPGPSVTANQLSVTVSYHEPPAALRSVMTAMKSEDIANTGKEAKWITLADGASRILLPPGWQRSSRIIGRSDMGSATDYLRPIKGTKGVVIGIMWTPQGFHDLVKAENLRGLQSDIVSGRLDGLLRAAGSDAAKLKQGERDKVITQAAIGSATGFTIHNRSGKPLAPMATVTQLFGVEMSPRFMTTVARGQKMYGLHVAASESTAGLKTLLGSFQPR